MSAAETREAPKLFVLGWELLKLGALAFGGLGATLVLLQPHLVDRRGWLEHRGRDRSRQWRAGDRPLHRGR